AEFDCDTLEHLFNRSEEYGGELHHCKNAYFSDNQTLCSLPQLWFSYGNFLTSLQMLLASTYSFVNCPIVQTAFSGSYGIALWSMSFMSMLFLLLLMLVVCIICVVLRQTQGDAYAVLEKERKYGKSLTVASAGGQRFHEYSGCNVQRAYERLVLII
ncbi:hypothetical protein Tcan_01605, partial [Toxocara canis]